MINNHSGLHNYKPGSAICWLVWKQGKFIFALFLIQQRVSASVVKYVNTRAFGIFALSDTLLVLDVEVSPNTGSHFIFPGEYRIKLVFAANNLSSINKIYSLIIADEWTEDPKEMLENYIFIKEERSMY